MAGLTIAFNSKFRSGRESVRIGTLTFDDSYLTGGESLTAADLNLTAITHIQIQSTGGYVMEYDYAASKVKAYWIPNDTNGVVMDEVTGAQNMATIVAKFRATGY